MDACLVAHRMFRTAQSVGDASQRHAFLRERSQLLQLL